MIEGYLQDLEEHHAIFKYIVALGTPVITDSIPTAAVEFTENSMSLLINKGFWNSLNDVQRKFVLSHEALHVFFNHGDRIKHLKDKSAANIAADLIVNHSLVNYFNFKRSEIDPNNKFIWIDKVFANPQKDHEYSSMEEYYNLLKSELESLPKDLQTLDDHSLMEVPEGMQEQIAENIESNVSEEEIQEFFDTISKSMGENKDSQIAGSIAGSLKRTMDTSKVKKKKKWESVIKKWSFKYTKKKDKEVEQWVHTNRRMFTLKSKLLLPTEYEIEYKDKDKIDVWFFQDTSGSCYHLADRFFKAAKTLPEDTFNVRMFCFDTQVYETSLQSGKLYGFGGTTFTCIENKIQQIIKTEKINYPKAVFVITDGYGNNVSPQFPKSWYWFLTGNYKYCIPNDSHVFSLKDYE